MNVWHNLTLKSSCLLLLVQLSGCVEGPRRAEPGELLIDTTGRYERATSASNLITSAVKREGEFDFVFFPTEGLKDNEFALIEPGMSAEEVEKKVLRLYKAGTDYDKLRVGTMRGSTIRNFVLNRTLETDRHDLHVAGLRYYIRIVGGLPQIYNIEMDNGEALEDDRYYRIAISDGEYFRSFPGYRFRHDFDRGLREERGTTEDLYATRYLKSYLSHLNEYGFWDDPRSMVEVEDQGVVAKPVKISEIQGISHISPLQGYRVTTTGVITMSAYSSDEGVYEFYLQSQESDWDDDPRTSEAVLVRVRDRGTITHGLDLSQRSLELDGQVVEAFEPGQLVRLSGVVYEDLTSTGMTRTSLSDISSFEILLPETSLPRPIYLSGDRQALADTALTGLAVPVSTQIPNETISSYRGNLNQKLGLNLADGIDFWESLEGMRVLINQPTIVGMGGGQKDFSVGQGDTKGAKQYMDLYLIAKDSASADQRTLKGGLQIEEQRQDFNPEIIKMTDHHFNDIVDSNYSFEIGDQFDSDLIGVLGYDINSFGGGEYIFFISNESINFKGLSGFRSLEEKPRTSLIASEDHLTIASFNVENLSVEPDEVVSGKVSVGRTSEIGRSIVINLRCPDILNLVEVQDNNGDAFSGDASAQATLESIIDAINRANQDKQGTEYACPHALDYQSINIDPKQNQEGGEPGGNIRVAMIYNAARVGFESRGQSGPLDETFLLPDGSLSANPGRVFPNDGRFSGTRKSLVAEFSFKGERVFVLGNHFNSKGGDTSFWAAQQPPVFGSERRRAGLADGINDFVEMILAKDPQAGILVLGDFNDFSESQAMRVLEDNDLANLISYQDQDGRVLVDPRDRYTYNYAGNSQPLDMMFASPRLLSLFPEMEIPHINTDYMRQVADHDPIVARFNFAAQ